MTRYDAETEACYVVGFDYAERNGITIVEAAEEIGPGHHGTVTVANITDALRDAYEVGYAAVLARAERAEAEVLRRRAGTWMALLLAAKDHADAHIAWLGMDDDGPRSYDEDRRLSTAYDKTEEAYRAALAIEEAGDE